MWPFNCKDDDSQENEIRQHQLAWPIGTKFKYLGVNMIVTDNYGLAHDIPSSYFYKTIRADYVDGHGVIRKISFNPNEFNNLERE